MICFKDSKGLVIPSLLQISKTIFKLSSLLRNYILPLSLILVGSTLCLVMGNRSKRSQFSPSTSSAVTLSKELVVLLQRHGEFRRCLLAERQKVGFPRKKKNHTKIYGDRFGGRNS